MMQHTTGVILDAAKFEALGALGLGWGGARINIAHKLYARILNNVILRQLGS